MAVLQKFNPFNINPSSADLLNVSALLTNSSTYSTASDYATVILEEVSGNGYSRQTLTVNSSTLGVDNVGRISYGVPVFTASGGDIIYDRLALVDSSNNLIGYFVLGSTTVTDGSSSNLGSLLEIQTSSSSTLTGNDGQSAFTLTTANFTQPAASATVIVSVENSGFCAVGQGLQFDDDTNQSFYTVQSIDSTTQLTLLNTGAVGNAAPSTTMQSGGRLVPSGVAGPQGANGVSGGSGLSYSFNSTITSPAGTGQLRLNNATFSLVTEIYAYELDRNGADVSAVLDVIPVFSIAQVSNEDLSGYAFYQITGLVDNGTMESDRTISVSHLSSNGSFANGENVTLSFTLAGSGPPFAGVTADTTTVRTLTDSDNGQTIQFTYASATPEIVVTLPDSLTAPFACRILHDSDADLSFTTSGTASTIAARTLTQSKGRGSVIDVRALTSDSDRFWLAGDLLEISSGALTSATTAPTDQSITYEVDVSSGSFDLTLPLWASTSEWVTVEVIRVDDSANTFNVVRSGSDTIRPPSVGGTTLGLSPGDVFKFRPSRTVTDTWLVS